MIFALRHPAELLGLALGFLVGVVARVTAQRLAIGTAGGSRRSGLRVAGPRPPGLRPRGGWAAYLDPYGTIAAVLGGAGWGARPPSRRGGASDVRALLAALVAHAALAAAGFAAFAAAGGPLGALGGLSVSDVLRGDVYPPQTGQSIALAFALINVACGLLALFPVPPLELGVVLWSRLPRSAGSRRMAYRLLEEQWGVAIILVLLLLPIGGKAPVLLVLIDDVAAPILRAL